ncbi:hypothetical protein WMF37_45670 [Sorangium sp. So ce291]|uniref:hypothetical protein n=1 Tax=Sorangium sp. So ce291 TaxID=3133294 RepID=UPI003F5EFE4A
MSRTLPSRLHPTPLGYLIGPAMQPVATTSIREAGKNAFLSPLQDQGETVRLFRIEPEPFRHHFGLEPNAPIADALFLYLKETEGAPAQWVVFVVELKGKDHNHALKQMQRTIQALRDKLGSSLGRAFLAGENLRAVLVSDRGSPARFHEALEDFRRQTRVTPYLCVSGRVDLRQYLAPSRR